MAITKGFDNSQRACHTCQAAYTPKRDWQKTCSHVCGYTMQNAKKKRHFVHEGLCGRCGTTLIHKRRNAIYCSKTCKSMDHTFKHRGKTRVQGTARRKEIYDRDAGLCYMCKTKLQLNEVELDHLIPVSKNGTSEPRNLAVSCRGCNRGRGARIGLDQLTKLTELRATL